MPPPLPPSPASVCIPLLSILPCCVRGTPRSMAFQRKFNIGSFGVSMNSIGLLPLFAPDTKTNRGCPAKSSKHHQSQPFYLVFEFLMPLFIFCLFLSVWLSTRSIAPPCTWTLKATVILTLYGRISRLHLWNILYFFF